MFLSICDEHHNTSESPRISQNTCTYAIWLAMRAYRPSVCRHRFARTAQTDVLPFLNHSDGLHARKTLYSISCNQNTSHHTLPHPDLSLLLRRLESAAHFLVEPAQTRVMLVVGEGFIEPELPHILLDAARVLAHRLPHIIGA